MAVPTITSVSPVAGPSSGGDLVRITGTGFADSVAVLIGGVAASVLGVHVSDAATVVDVHSPAHDPGRVSVELHNLDVNGLPIAGESVVVPLAYTFERTNLVLESDLTRIVRKLLRDLKRQLIANTSMSVSVDYDGGALEEDGAVAIATLPGVVLSGPRMRPNRTLSTNELAEKVVAVGAGYELQRQRPPTTMDLLFTLTGACERTAEALNLMSAVVAYFNRNQWLEVERDPANSSLGTVLWEMSPEGELSTSYRTESQTDSRVFSYSFTVFGVDVDEGLALDRNVAVETIELETGIVEQVQ